MLSYQCCMHCLQGIRIGNLIPKTGLSPYWKVLLPPPKQLSILGHKPRYMLSPQSQQLHKSLPFSHVKVANVSGPRRPSQTCTGRMDRHSGFYHGPQFFVSHKPFRPQVAFVFVERLRGLESWCRGEQGYPCLCTELPLRIREG